MGGGGRGREEVLIGVTLLTHRPTWKGCGQI